LNIIKISNIDSTNNYAAKLVANKEFIEETLIYTDYQKQGKGLGKNKWYSEKNKNILASLIVFPEIKVEQHFQLNMIISISICEYLQIKGVSAKIKWPNDIYVKDDKIAGILVENRFYGDKINNSVIGVGLNLNQTDFPSEVLNPVSLKTINNQDYNIENEIKELFLLISKGIKSLQKFKSTGIKSSYLDKLYRYDEWSYFKKENFTFEAKIIDVKNDGYIVLVDKNGNKRDYYFKEVEYNI